MSRSLTIRKTFVYVCFLGCTLGTTLGLNCAGDPGGLDPSVPAGNRPPRVIITDVATPSGDSFAQQGDTVTIAFTADDGEDQSIVRVFASLAANPTIDQEIPIMTGFVVGPGAGSGAASWDTTPIVPGSYHIFAEIDDGTYDAVAQTGNPAVRVTAGSLLTIAPPGTAPENGAPTISIELPATDAGLSNRGVLTVRYRVKDPNSDEDTLNMTIFFDKDRDQSNDATQPPLVVATDVIAAGTMLPDEYNDPARQTEIEIDLNTVPIRIQTDEGGRPLPYYVRIRANDGQNIVDKYAVGSVRVLAAPSDVVDLLQIGSTAAGATWQGFDGDLAEASEGSRAGSTFTSLGDLDGDGIDDFAIAAQKASTMNADGVGEAYIVYGRERHVDPDATEFTYAQGRYAGVLNVNSIGSTVSFPPDDPRYQTVFNIRGSILPHPGVQQPPFGMGSMGIESLAVMPDITGDQLPEMLVGSPFNDNVFDQEDDDPCDTCEFDTDTFEPLIVFEDRVDHFGDNALTGDVEGIDAAGANRWAPFDPSTPVPFFSGNVELEGEDERLFTMYSFQVEFSGTLGEGVPIGPFELDILFDDPNSRMETVLVQVGTEGEFEFTYVNGLGAGLWPVVPSANFPVDPTDAMSPSVYDGVMGLFVRPNVAVEFDSISVRVEGTSFTGQEHNVHYAYFDSFPGRLSTASSSSENLLADPFALRDLEPACPPYNRHLDPLNDSFLGAATFGNRDGHLFNEVAGALSGCGGLTNDSLGDYQSGLAFVCGSDNLALQLNENGYWLRGTGARVANLSRFGQPPYVSQGGSGLIGARFRGAWYQQDEIYDPESLFGYTVDVMPDISTTWGAVETLFSAPGGGSFTRTNLLDLGADLSGTYNNSLGGTKSASSAFDFGLGFNRVIAATLTLSGSSVNVPRVRVGIADTTTGLPIPTLSRVILMWRGAEPAGEDATPSVSFDSIFGDTIDFAGLTVSLPEAALAYLRNGTGTLAVEILDDCVATESSFTITSASFELAGLASDTGMVVVVNGSDYTSDLEGPWCGGSYDGDPESAEGRPMSWPSYGCDTENDLRLRCYPPELMRLQGEQRGDSLGFAHYAGDVNIDGVADLACGAPGSDNDPFLTNYLGCDFASEPAPLTDNGKVYLVYGKPTLRGNYLPCELARFEIRGTHNDDQFGRVQGRAGDMDGDGYDDFFFAAEGYDADGHAGLDPRGPDAGFVGVLFGRSYGQATKSITPEEVGTAPFPGCKFIGGSAGARLGGGTPANTSRFASMRGQHGVSNAGDFNLDGYEDLLITAPGQVWPGANIEFTSDVPASSSVTINGNLFVFPTAMSGADAQQFLVDELGRVSPETLDVSSITSRLEFPAAIPGDPTVTFLARRPSSFSVTTTAPTVVVTPFLRQGVAYLVFGDEVLLTNKTFVLPDDLNRRNIHGNRVLKGMVFVSAYEQNTGAGDPTPNEAPIEAVSVAGDVDNDGFVDILLGSPQADFINILEPEQRLQATGEAYLIYGNEYGLNEGSRP